MRAVQSALKVMHRREIRTGGRGEKKKALVRKKKKKIDQGVSVIPEETWEGGARRAWNDLKK